MSEQDPKDDDRAIARGNPWARAVQPDDDKAKSPVMYVVFGLLSLVMIMVFVGALVLPPMFMHTLLIRGIRTERWGLFALGVLLAVIYLLVLWAIGKRLMSKPKPPPSTDAN